MKMFKIRPGVQYIIDNLHLLETKDQINIWSAGISIHVGNFYGLFGFSLDGEYFSLKELAFLERWKLKGAYDSRMTEITLRDERKHAERTKEVLNKSRKEK